ncbi:hypothetical protein M0J30_001544 [Klebsiella oxytoca]|uniref:hypothetical protein n=1 Tax=Klebsiella oxytoca TaxID=571 RepID=UPI000D00FD10|nr:hypothetical protein [Klebsiella oxytoca]AVL82653.1 hypothetical protein CEQ13_21885 [Klebsiella oxytoca]EKX5081801.1 hypothetical protein [Klebsiella oxytoca]EKX5093815.1 hypothetical protein [Klebsiella oxytoca]ELQ8985501.1 hypothetical protein [Klebsiella oxytoca]MBZ7704158.1 hypothetical protein [Klebsiella oxytoca]
MLYPGGKPATRPSARKGERLTGHDPQKQSVTPDHSENEADCAVSMLLIPAKWATLMIVA